MRLLMIATLSLTLATAAMAKPPLRDVQHINDGLLYVGLADEIRKNCSSISGRIFKGVARLRAIHKSAVEMGYTKAEIETFVDSRAEKNRLKARGRAYLKANGASLSKPATMCALGRKEIAANSAIGTLLYEN
ncbi:DUF5333 domain-containing protein [Amylibacter sp. IMCC11727]|uniref:DUF5333 domain-containing protein n=1 Tax=Amylibacter sp. IMCC11727 TaxID=3039851 RepID=UPI00244DC0CA|nr:DUF5333 domain-containing protein [Amylibacter sp. IMCC11727]WGI23398.1 DUF5333 domain-containing protein [Amylibacter sp. IMCC11727]